jgi:putative two-component system response regulator
MDTARKPVILIVDDVAENRRILATILNKNTDYTVMLAGGGEAVLDAIEDNIPDLILLDIMMPKMDGYEVASILKQRKSTRGIPIVFITAVTEIESVVRAFEAGGVDYITKPFNKEELLSRVNTHMKIKLMQDELKQKNELLADRELHLTNLVEEKTKKLENTTGALITALESANFYNDSDTGSHIKRVSEYSALFARGVGADSDFVKRIRLYASLHDVGKVGLSDALLKKPGKYTPEEFDRMKEHVRIGERMLDNPEIDPMARNIALYHHEKWDGSGYLKGLTGEEIPLEARIVAIADVYDALSQRRVYKDAFAEEKVDTIIREGRGSHFDPELVDVYFDGKPQIIAIRDRYSDHTQAEAEAAATT